MDNSGIITNSHASAELGTMARYAQGKNALVAQGGGQRGIFTAGVLDAFILSNFDPFDAFYGTSAGVLNLCAFLCRQNGLGRAFIIELTTSSEFFNLFSYIRHKQFLGLDWAMERICDYPYRLDVDLGRRALGDRTAMAAVTDNQSLKDHYLPMLQDDWLEVAIASCAIPRLYKGPITLSGKEYIDGGVSASIPVQEAWRDNARFIAVIRTESQGVGPAPLELDLANKKMQPDVQSELDWFNSTFNTLSTQWQLRLGRWKSDWNNFIYQQIMRSKEQKHDHDHVEEINGGRWLFGAHDIYRLSHLVGDKFDSHLLDMLMVHYQTYSLTSDFLASPPDDCFVAQIMPAEPLKSSSLLSSKEDLLHDYQLGLDAGYRFIDTYNQAQSTLIKTGS